MPKKQAVQIAVAEIACFELENLVARPSSPQKLVLRARVIIGASQGQTNAEMALQYGVGVKLVRKWRKRWQALQGLGLDGLSVEERLRDAPRSGRHSRFTPEQVCKITALACEKPNEGSLRPISQWSSREIAAEVDPPRHCQ